MNGIYKVSIAMRASVKKLARDRGAGRSRLLAVIFLTIAIIVVWRGDASLALRGEPLAVHHFALRGEPLAVDHFALRGEPLAVDHLALRGEPLAVDHLALRGEPLAVDHLALRGEPLAVDHLALRGEPLAVDHLALRGEPLAVDHLALRGEPLAVDHLALRGEPLAVDHLALRGEPLAVDHLALRGEPLAVHPPPPNSNIAKNSPTPLNKIASATLFNHFSDHPKNYNELVKSFEVPPIYKRSKGLFVTLSKNGKTRACWGSIQPQEGNLVAATVVACEEALTKEYRYPPVRKNEINDLKCQVTVVEKMEAVGAHVSLNPLLDGLMVRSGSRAAVLLPGEASDPHYQVMQCKLKAGIKPQDPCQIYRMRAHVFR